MRAHGLERHDREEVYQDENSGSTNMARIGVEEMIKTLTNKTKILANKEVTFVTIESNSCTTS